MWETLAHTAPPPQRSADGAAEEPAQQTEGGVSYARWRTIPALVSSPLHPSLSPLGSLSLSFPCCTRKTNAPPWRSFRWTAPADRQKALFPPRAQTARGADAQTNPCSPPPALAALLYIPHPLSLSSLLPPSPLSVHTCDADLQSIRSPYCCCPAGPSSLLPLPPFSPHVPRLDAAAGCTGAMVAPPPLFLCRRRLPCCLLASLRPPPAFRGEGALSLCVRQRGGGGGGGAAPASSAWPPLCGGLDSALPYPPLLLILLSFLPFALFP